MTLYTYDELAQTLRELIKERDGLRVKLEAAEGYYDRIIDVEEENHSLYLRLESAEQERDELRQENFGQSYLIEQLRREKL